MTARRSRFRSALTRSAALLLALTLVRPLWAAPGDMTQIPAPALGADPPKSRDIPDGDASVATQTGDFSYSYPITVPPARLGMGPSLALSYSSQAPIYGGIAAGWSLSIPEITLDTSQSLMRANFNGVLWGSGPYVSSMAGGRPLVAVTETAPPDVMQTYRAKNDSTWARYERMPLSAGLFWRVRTPDGVTHYFGETSRAPSSRHEWAPLTRSVDSFGNTVEYIWEGWQLAQIHYTSNPGANLPAFARVEFVWVDGPQCNGMVVGSQEDRRVGITRGAKQLAKIRALAFKNGATEIDHTREITLVYSSSLAACNQKHAPTRVLESIQESAWGNEAPRVDLPAVTFEYNRFERNFDSPVVQALPWQQEFIPPGLATGWNLGWGFRRKGGEWPSVEAMMLDFDGDGLQDRIRAYEDPATPNSCMFVWSKNLGRQLDGSIAFSTPSVPYTLPRLDWRDSNKSALEWCSLSAQFTLKETETVPTTAQCIQTTGTYLAYRWMDMTGDRLPDLVTAIHHDPQHFDPDDISNFGPWPSCTPAPACPAVSSDCADQAIDCSVDDAACSFDEGSINACLDVSPGVPCARLMKQAPPGSYDDCSGTCAGNEDCQRICANSDRIEPPTTQATCDYKKPHERCGRYPWIIYENLGGEISTLPQIKYQPVPLESDAGDSSFGGGTISSTQHAVQDIDGDGNLDAVVRGGYSELDFTIDYKSHKWLVFPGDGNGGFLSRSTGWPFVWLVPDGAPIGAGCTSQPDQICSPYTAFNDPPLHEYDHDVRGLSSLIDLNGDGALDLVWKMADNEFLADTAPYGWEAVEEDDPIVVYLGNNRQFEYGDSPSSPSGQALAAGGIAYFSRSEVEAQDHTTDHFMAQGLRRSKTRFVDVDLDGRPDLLESNWTGTGWEPLSLFVNHGGVMLPGIQLGAMEAERWRQETEADRSGLSESEPRGFFWQSKKDVADLDGDGIPEVWNFDGNAFQQHRDSDSQPMRLMKKIRNGRGATIEVEYAPTTDKTVVTQTAGLTSGNERHALPSTQWVVKTMSVKDKWDGDISKTEYAYTHPVWKPDDEERWGFRGFETVTTTRPSLAKQVDRYDYSVDWSGRLKTTLVYDAADTLVIPLVNPRSISETTWESKLLFGNAVKTFHPQTQRSWTCSNGQTESGCRNATDNCVTTRYVYQHLPLSGAAQLYYANQIYTLGGNYDGYYAGDRRRVETKALFSDTDDYRLKDTFIGTLELASASPFQETWTSYELLGYDTAYRAQTSSDRYLDFSTSPYERAVTFWDYDWTTGVLQWVRNPRNFPGGPVEAYVYDATKRFATTVTNELGQTVQRDYHGATGALRSTIGPGASSCGTGCTNAEQTWTDIDGLGRPTATYVNVPVPGATTWQQTKVSRSMYIDTIVSDARTKVVTENLIDWGGTRWTREETQLDGQGRPDEVIVETGGTGHDAVTTYDYDHRGLLVGVTLPDPSQNTTATVEYKYGYDSLGRPTSMRRPPVGGTEPSGINLSYDGLVHQREEVAGSQGGPVGRTTLLHDRFGRLTEVREYTDLATNTYATTTYQYDPRDAVRRIQNPDGVVTELVHDMGGRRKRILRANKTWSYGYNSSGDLTSESVPPPTPAEAASYTTTYAYDAIGRPSSRNVGIRTMTTLAEQQLFGIGTITFSHDTCTNGTGRLCTVTFPHGVLTTNYTYDAEGNAASETRAFNFAGVTGTRTSSALYGPGGKVIDQTYADGTPGASDATRALFLYDDRALPQTVRWVRAGIPGALTVANQTRNTAGLVTSRATGLLVTGWREHTSTWTYDQLTRVTSQTITNNLNEQLAKQELTYFGQDDPKRLKHWLGSSPYELNFVYDARHQLKEVKESGGRYDAYYDFTPAGKLSHVRIEVPGTPGPGADAIPRDVDYEYASPSDPDAVSALTPVTGGTSFRSYTYDTAGNMLTRSAGTMTETFLYDGENRLRRAQTGAATRTEEYFYDHDGNRVAVVSKMTLGGVENVRVFGGNSETLLSATGSIQETYANLRLGSNIARVLDRGVLELQYHDASENVVFAVLPEGVVRAGFVYAPYGEVLLESGDNSHRQRQRFNDKRVDEATGLHYYGVRYYDKVLIGWTQGDPAYRFAPDFAWIQPRRANLYSFSGSNPVRYIDPDGRDILDKLAMVSPAAQVADLVRDAVGGDADPVEIVVGALPGRPGDVAALGMSAYAASQGDYPTAAVWGVCAAIPGAGDKVIRKVALGQIDSVATKAAGDVAAEAEARLIGAEVDAAFDGGRVTSGTMFQFSDAAGPLAGSGPKAGTKEGGIWYHDNIKVPGVGPKGACELRTHSANPNAPQGSYSSTNYTTQVNSGDFKMLPDGTFKHKADLTDDEMAAIHIPAGN